jgi:hypothetical protein
MQVSKGLKRATGRDEQFQHHLGALNCLPGSLKFHPPPSSKPIVIPIGAKRSGGTGFLL